MSLDLHKILKSKREFRQRLAALPIARKLDILDSLRERALAIRPTRPASSENMLHEEPLPPRIEGEGPD
jgi:hypothetical protein